MGVRKIAMKGQQIFGPSGHRRSLVKGAVSCGFKRLRLSKPHLQSLMLERHDKRRMCAFDDSCDFDHPKALAAIASSLEWV